MRTFIKNIIGNEPYGYQLRVAELLLGGKNVILSVPTGAGKTWASIAPFLFAKVNPQLYFPSKMIYSSPLRTLTNSIYEDVAKVFKDAKIQTGEFNEDIYFESDVIFSTIDQTLSNFLCFPLPLSQAQANINAGALIGTYLIFDEFHLLDPKRSMATTIGMLKMLGNLTRCCIMTATLEGKFMDKLKDTLENNYEIITLDDSCSDKEIIGSLFPKKNKKSIYYKDSVLNAHQIAENHQRKTIVICNRVETAQKIYREVIALKEKAHILTAVDKNNIICLHSRFFNEDRKKTEVRLKELFGKESDANEQAILIATQIIEAGMDLSCDIMHTEISPINSFLQRAGRCARFANQTGTIFIYDVLDSMDRVSLNIAIEEEDKKEINKINNKFLPYEESECSQALLEIKNHDTLDGDIPKTMIENISKTSSNDLIRQMSLNSSGGFNQGKIKESWESCNKNFYRDTIRDIQSVDVILINNEMIREINRFPFRYQSLSIYKWSLVGWLTKILKGEGPMELEDGDWLSMELKEPNNIFLENDEDQKFELKRIQPENIKHLSNQVFLNVKYFGYDRDFGLNWQYEESFENPSPRNEKVEKEDTFKPLTKDTFYEHNMGLIGAFEKEFLPKLDFTFKALSDYLQLSDFSKKKFIEIIKLMIILHDYGKLNGSWQKPIQKYQFLKDGASKEILAHTDFDKNSRRDVELGKEAGLTKRPSHAGVGAYVSQEIIEDIYDNDFLKSSISMAIARHHSALSVSYPDFKINPDNYTEMQRLLTEFNCEIELEKENFRGNLEGFETDWYGERIAYLFFVRILRLCDQKATSNLRNYIN
ncbi:MAG: CRISPR-associated helicase Cas3' [Chitinophagaceae bacterium]|nr:MAG: CRISPR-associated helicase Cas3' [Chitinophagaceae bacterium]